MSSLTWLIPAALFLGLLGLAAFLWSLRSGQYDDLDGAAWAELRAVVVADLFGTAQPIEGVEPAALLEDPVQALAEQVSTP